MIDSIQQFQVEGTKRLENISGEYTKDLSGLDIGIILDCINIYDIIKNTIIYK